MSKGNPRKAMAALLPLPIRIGEADERSSERSAAKGAKTASTIYVRPITLGMFAALERIGSPLVTGEDPKDLLDMIPSLYLVTHDPREVFRGNILDLAMQWADAQPVTAVEAVKAAFYRQMNAAFDVMPELDPKKARGAGTTAGCPRSSTGSPKGTGGGSRRSCGSSRSRRSASSGGART